MSFVNSPLASMAHTQNGIHNTLNLLAARREAVSLYRQAYAKGQLRRWRCKLGGRCGRLTALADRVSVTIQPIDLGLQTVPISKIIGSEGRANDFDDEFVPQQSHTHDKWVSVAAAWRSGRPLPPVELIRVGDSYFVRDGHHRLSVAHQLGQATIDAHVTLWQPR